MAQVVQAACPGCRQVLRIPHEWVEQPMKCKHCGLVFRARTKAAAPPPAPQPVRPAAARPAVAPAAPVAPFADLTDPTPEAPAGTAPTAPFDFDALPSSRRRRRRSRGGWWKGAVLALCTLGVAAVVAVLAWPTLSRLAPALGQLADVKETTPRSPEAAPPKTEGPAESVPPKHVPPITSARRPAEPFVPPAKEPPSSGAKFPRRALVVCVSNYLYFNPVSYGTSSSLFDPRGVSHAVHSLLGKLNLGLDIPLGQIVELSDATPEPPGKRGPRAVAPVKPVIEQTVGDFLRTARAQDRILLMFIGHAVELDGEVFLVPIDGERDRKESLIPLKWLYDRLAACKARQKIVVVDVCRFDPSRGFERPGSGSPDGKVEGGMTAKMDEAFLNPPAGVQLWSACVADQQSLEYEENGVFVEALWDQLGQKPPGIIQRADGPIPIDRLVDGVNRGLANKLRPHRRTQTSRLVGKEPEEGAAYDPSEPLPPNVVPKPPVAGADAYAVKDLRKLLGEIAVPPIRIARDVEPLRAESLPPFAAKVMEAYPEAEGPDTELRQAVKASVKVLGKVRNMHLKVEWSYPGDENAMKRQITDHQRTEVAGIMRELDEALKDLQKVGTPEALEKEPRRWQANHDFVLARLEEELAYLNEFQGVLGQLKTALPPIDKKAGQNGWRVASQLTPSDSAAKKLATEAKKVLARIVKDYPDTPWAVHAKRDRLTALGMEWQAARLGQ